MTYFLIVVGLPTLVVAVSLAATGGKGYADPQSCWLSTRNHILWAFVVPALLIVSVSSGCHFMYACMNSHNATTKDGQNFMLAHISI